MQMLKSRTALGSVIAGLLIAIGCTKSGERLTSSKHPLAAPTFTGIKLGPTARSETPPQPTNLGKFEVLGLETTPKAKSDMIFGTCADDSGAQDDSAGTVCTFGGPGARAKGLDTISGTFQTTNPSDGMPRLTYIDSMAGFDNFSVSGPALDFRYADAGGVLLGDLTLLSARQLPAIDDGGLDPLDNAWLEIEAKLVSKAGTTLGKVGVCYHVHLLFSMAGNKEARIMNLPIGEKLGNGILAEGLITCDCFSEECGAPVNPLN
jgi:hypothetical protein